MRSTNTAVRTCGRSFHSSLDFLVAMVGLMGKLELPPFDAPEAETEIVSGALTEYSGRGLALFRLGKDIELVIGLTLVAAFYLGGLANPLEFPAEDAGIAVGDGRICSRCSLGCALTRRLACGGRSVRCWRCCNYWWMIAWRLIAA